MQIKINSASKAEIESVIGIFDMDTATISPITKDFMKSAQSDGRLTDADGELPKSFVLTDDGRVSMSRLSVAPLTKRCVRGKNFCLRIMG